MIRKLDDLKEDELREIKNRIEYILLTKGTKAHEHSQDLKLKAFFSLIEEELEKKLNVRQKTNYWVFKKKNTFYKKLKESYNLLHNYQDDNMLDLNPVTTKKFQLISIKLLMEYLEKIPVPLSLTTILNNFDKVPGLINIAFPDYAENNLLHKII